MHDLRHAAASAPLSEYHNHPDFRILRRVLPLDDITLKPRGEGPTRRVAIVDVETTGTDPLLDEVIDVAVVTLEVDAAGEIVGIISAAEALRDPGMPIPPYITTLTGIRDDDVRGKSINLDRLEARLASADVLIAHNAHFDCGFLQNLMPGLAGAAWACSAADFDWVGVAGLDGYKLGHLLMQVGWFNGAHRAMADVISLIHLLSHRLPHGGTVLGDLLANAAMPTLRVEATGADFSSRGVLKARGYRWDPRARVWWCEVAEDERLAEERWLREHVTPHGPLARVTPITWHQRHR